MRATEQLRGLLSISSPTKTLDRPLTWKLKSRQPLALDNKYKLTNLMQNLIFASVNTWSQTKHHFESLPPPRDATPGVWKYVEPARRREPLLPTQLGSVCRCCTLHTQFDGRPAKQSPSKVFESWVAALDKLYRGAPPPHSAVLLLLYSVHCTLHRRPEWKPAAFSE